MKNSFKALVIGLGICSLSLSFLFSSANNIRIGGTVQVSQGTGDTLVLSFPLRWDNSWRDQFNWDAAWVFLKYKSGAGGWNHVNLCSGGHRFVNGSGLPVPFDCMPGNTGSSTVGLFVHRNTLEAGNTPEIICQVKCLKSALGGLTPENFQNHGGFVLAQAVETVYIPYGGYYLGDGESNKSVQDTVFNPDKDIIGTDPSFIYSASSTYRPAPGPEIVADRVNNSLNNHVTNWQSGNSPSDQLAWWMVDFGNARVIRSFGVSGASDYPTCRPSGIWFLEASNTANDVDWTGLWSGGPEYWGTSVVSYPVRRPINFSNHTAYRYYRIRMEHSAYSLHPAYIIANLSMSESVIDRTGVLIDSEKAYTFSINSGSDISIPATFPKGYNGFYMMKYEVSQEQWIYFLNTLTYIQQQERVPGLAGLKSGEFIFGSKSEPSNRNGIVVAEPSYGGNPVIFANNLNSNTTYSEDGDGKTIACNYLSPSDMTAYCSWTGLRPMSEPEYEKACRQSYPETPVKGEYAWHDNSITGRLNAVTNSGLRNERSNTASANVNAGNTFGPVRCGLFATGSSTQQSAGAAFWGGMELSGNLKEICYNITYTGFNGATIGTGIYNTALWSATPDHFGVRGGGFTSPDDLLRVSDRTEASGYFTNINQRDSTVGFRAVRPIGSDVKVTQGKLIAKQGGMTITGTACPDIQLDLATDVPVKVMSGTNELANMDISYIWYVLKPGATEDMIISGATGATLSYNHLKAAGISASVTYKFRQKAICPVGESITDYITFTVPNMDLVLSSREVSLDACNISNKTVTATVPGGSNFTWHYKENLLVSGSNYVADRSHFGHEAEAGGDFKVICRYTGSGCQTEQDIIIHVAPDYLVCPASVRDDDGNIYPAVKIGCQCWMGKNLNVGTYEAISGNIWDFDKPGIQKWCNGNNEANCAAYGGLYEWWEVVCNGQCGEKLTQANAMSWGLTSESQLPPFGVRMVPGSTTQVQGICPDGWHLPSRAEWNILINKFGGFDSAGAALKSNTLWDGTNTSGWNGEPGNHKSTSGSFVPVGSDGFWWTSEPSSNGNLAWFYMMSRNTASVTANYRITGIGVGMSARCIKN